MNESIEEADILIREYAIASLEDLGELQGDRLWIVYSVISAEHGDQMRRSQVDHDRSHLPRTVLRESLGYVGLAQVVPPQKFITLGEDVEGLRVVLGQECDLESSSPVEDAAIVEDGLGSHQDAVHAMHVVPRLVVPDELASHPFQDQLVVELRA